MHIHMSSILGIFFKQFDQMNFRWNFRVAGNSNYLTTIDIEWQSPCYQARRLADIYGSLMLGQILPKRRLYIYT